MKVSLTRVPGPGGNGPVAACCSDTWSWGHHGVFLVLSWYKRQSLTEVWNGHRGPLRWRRTRVLHLVLSEAPVPAEPKCLIARRKRQPGLGVLKKHLFVVQTSVNVKGESGWNSVLSSWRSKHCPLLQKAFVLRCSLS